MVVSSLHKRPSDRPRGRNHSKRSLPVGPAFRILVYESIMPNAMKRFARTVEILQGNDGDQFVVGADVNANRLMGLQSLVSIRRLAFGIILDL